MLTIRYTATVLAITLVALIIGVILWNSEESQTINADLLGGWSRGPSDAPVVIETFVDFT